MDLYRRALLHMTVIEFHNTVFLYNIHVSVVLNHQTPLYKEIISGIIFRSSRKFVFLSKPVAVGLKQLAGNGGAPSKTCIMRNHHPWKVMVILHNCLHEGRCVSFFITLMENFM